MLHTTSVDVDNNALVADLVRDTMESDATRSATGWAVGGSTDTGSITTGSGMKTLDAYIVDAIAATGTVSVWFDTVTKLEVQVTQGGSYTDQTSNLGTVAIQKHKLKYSLEVLELDIMHMHMHLSSQVVEQLVRLLTK